MYFLKADACHLPFPDKSFDFVFGSPPYQDCRTYGIGATRKCQAWIDWMLECTAESVRVSRGLVIWILGGATRNHCYQPGLKDCYTNGGRAANNVGVRAFGIASAFLAPAANSGFALTLSTLCALLAATSIFRGQTTPPTGISRSGDQAER